MTLNVRQLLRSLKYRLAPHLAVVVAKLLTSTYKTVALEGDTAIQQLLNKKLPFLPCYWHGQEVACVNYLLKLQQHGLKIAFLTSPSRDGEIGAKVLTSQGAKVIRGSSSQTGAKALRDVYWAISKENLSIATTPDGPRGPVLEFKPGWIILAQISGSPLIPLACAADRAWQLNNWCKFIIPKPFAKISIAIGEPVYIEKKLTPEQLAELQIELSQVLNSLTVKAQEALPKI